MTHLLSLNITRNREAVAVDESKSTTSRSVQARGSLNSGKNGCPWSLKASLRIERSLVLTTAAPVSIRATATKIQVFASSVIVVPRNRRVSPFMKRGGPCPPYEMPVAVLESGIPNLEFQIPDPI